MILKKLLLVFTAVLIFVPQTAYSEQQRIRSGTFIKVLSREEINTLSADKNDIVTFLNLYDMYVYETNAIPANTLFYGRVEDVREPMQGKDAAIKISIYKMVTPDKKTYNLKAHLYGDSDNYLGGKQTESAYYHKVYNHSKGFRPMLQVVPLNVYDMGRHTVLRAGNEFFIVTEEDIWI